MTTFIRFGDFHVHYEYGYGYGLQFEVYPVSDWTGLNGTSGVAYQSKETSDMIDHFDRYKARMLMNGRYVWRGIWESRIYFEDGEELWGEELEELAHLFTTHIRPWAEEFIKKMEPGINKPIW